MSETDDTDVLLLIPPNFFLICSSESDNSLLESSRTVVHKPVSRTAHVLSKLVDQVHSLESRLDTLELNTSTTFSTTSSIKNKTCNDSYRSLDRKCSTFPRRRRRKVLRRDKCSDLSLTSFDCMSLHRNIPKLKLPDTTQSRISETINDSQSMDGDISSIISTPSKTNDKLLLHEIDEFLTRVECYETPETRFKGVEKLGPESIIQATSSYIAQQLETKNDENEIQLPSGRKVTSEILDKYIYLVKNNALSDKEASGKKSENVENSNYTASQQTKPDIQCQSKSPSVRKLNFNEKDAQTTSTPKKYSHSASYLENFKPSSNKIYDQASKVLEQYKSQSYSQNAPSSVTDTNDYLSEKGDFKMPQMRPFVDSKNKMTALQIDSIDTDLLSLSELWGEKGERLERADSLKLEEERLKREHCEVMIQQLQRKILEQQEKLAVAIRVDRGKDTAINKLRDAWLRLTHSLDRAEERHRAALEKMVKEVDNFKMVANDAQKKTRHFESELYKALDLAHDYQEKCKQITQEKKELQESTDKVIAEKEEILRSKEKEIEVVKDNCETIMRLNKQSADCVKNLEDALEKERREHELTKSRLSELSDKIQLEQDEATLARQERDVLKEKVNEERSRCNLLERQLCEAQNLNSDLVKRCESLDGEVKSMHKQLEVQKNEVRGHYQRQLEAAVLAKLHDFQAQLHQAQQDMEEEARAKENTIVDTYNAQISRIEEHDCKCADTSWR
ncbi:probable DNA double-strand break repair Rad50 ATPase isoform X2 [Papilio machaon]|uniref:probable DNA double-strand break repair Rad50 ATPase isoform X2 n=1 Tax=Papilio machaon TaxID=76193 RepID=UPI001E664B23|nr:probable DNA double-strand break repair Rad50 ATPase isoform X2 [Papilio machaon]